MAAQSETPLYEMPVLTLKAIAEKMAAMDKEVILVILCQSIKMYLKMIFNMKKRLKRSLPKLKPREPND